MNAFPPRPTRLAHTLGAAALSFTLGGCAAITVDVDVYQGPLADNERVQMERVSVLATSAKPLLLRLRSELAGDTFLKQCAGKAVNQDLASENLDHFLRGCDFTQVLPEGCLIDLAQPGCQVAAGRAASLVNGVLSLYDDALGDPSEQGFTHRMQTAGAIFEQSYRRFTARLGSDWEKFASHTVPDSPGATVLKNGYAALFNAPPRERKSASFDDLKTGNQTLALERCHTQGPSQCIYADPFKDETANTFYRVLAQPDFADAQAQALFADETDRKAFVRLVTDTATAFLLMRKSLHELVATGLTWLQWRAEEPPPSNNPDLDSALIRLVAMLVSGRNQNKAWNRKTGMPQLPSELVTDYPGWQRRDLVIGYLSRPSKEGARTLLAIDIAMQASADPKFEFGLSRVPLEDVDQLADLKTQLEGLTRLSASGFGGGRLPDGLETMINNYLTARQAAACGTADCSTSSLIDALARFSQKLLALTANEPLFATAGIGPTQEKYLRVLEAVGQSIRIQVNDINDRIDHDRRLDTIGEYERRAYARTHPMLSGAYLTELTGQLNAEIRTLNQDVADAENAVKEATETQQAAQNNLETEKSAPNPAEAARDAVKNLTADTLTATDTETPLTRAKQGLKGNADNAEVITYLETMKDPVLKAANAATDAATLIKALTDEAERITQANSVAAAAAQTAFDTADTRLRAAKTQKAALEKRLKTAQLASKELDKERAALFVPDQTASLTYQHLLANLDARIAELNKPATPPAASAEPNAAQLTEVRALFAARPPGPDTPFAGIRNPVSMNAKAVLDMVIAELRAEDIQAERSGAANPAIRTALERAMNYRTNMVYLHPASMYLQSSFPSSTLQDDPEVGWTNMLSNHANRAWFDPDELQNEREKARLSILASVDKQYWQTINRVELHGGGDTNYVIAKDDIGNWGVKSYASSPDKAVNAAKQLLLFAAPGQLGTTAGALGQAANATTATTVPDSQAGNARPTTVGDVYRRYQDDFTAKTTAMVESMKTSLDNNTLIDRFATHWKEKGCAEDAGITALRGVAPSKDAAITTLTVVADTPATPQQLANGLAAIRNWGTAYKTALTKDTLAACIKDDGNNGQTSKFTLEIAQTVVTDDISAYLQTLVDQRKQQIDAVENAILLMQGPDDQNL